MTYRLLATSRAVPADFPLDNLFDGDSHGYCHLVMDWGQCVREHFLIERDPFPEASDDD